MLPLPILGFISHAHASVDPNEERPALDTWDGLLELKSKLFSRFSVQTTVDEARRKFMTENPEMNPEDASSDFKKAIQELQDRGLLQQDKGILISKVTSGWGT